MPHNRSAKKNLRKSLSRRMHNRAIKRDIKDQVKKFLAAVKSGKAEDMKTEYNLSAKRLDKAAAKRIIHPNLAARRKAQLARMINEQTAKSQ